ncbi:MAG: PQQ-binding-like beta-propeller repeat protein [Planctomycetota bacterium]
MLSTLNLIALLAAQAAAPAPPPAAQESPGWPTFRGAHGDAVVPAPHPATWGAEQNLAWRVEVPGGGWSSPLVAGDLVFVTTAIQTAREDGGRPLGFAGGVRAPETRGAGAPKPTAEVTFQARAYSLADGALLWSRDLASRVPAHGIHPSNSFATETPASDGARLIVYFGAIGLVAGLDLEGNELWRREVGAYATTADFGTGSSIALIDGLAFVQCDNEEASFLAAFRAADGEPVWRVERPRGTSWASPLAWRTAGGTDLVVSGPDAVTGYEPASGAVRWRVEGIGGTFSASPVVAGERLIFGNSAQQRRGPLAALAAGARGVVEFRAEAAPKEGAASPLQWIVERAGPSFSSPVVAGGLVFVVDGQGVVTCRDAADGAELYRERLPDAFQVVASPWTDGAHVFVLSEGGTTFVLKAARVYELVGTNRIEGTYWGTPSSAQGALLLRSADSLICVRAAR